MIVIALLIIDVKVLAENHHSPYSMAYNKVITTMKQNYGKVC